MARRARGEILYDGCYAHIYSRALEKRNIFGNESDFNKFKSLLKQTKEKHGYRLYHYCLMNTHFHLVAGIQSLFAFSQGLKEVKQKYVRWIHAKKRRVGPVWWGRFGSRLIEDERYLHACGLYIESNPVRAGLVTKPEAWPYSSSRHYFLNQKDVLIDSYEHPSMEASSKLLGAFENIKGATVGSELFRIQVAENVFAG